MVGPSDVVQPWMPRADRYSDAWLCHVSIAGGARRRGCAAAGVSEFLDGPLEHAEPLRAACGLDARVHAELAVEVGHVRADGLLADEQPLGDLAVGQAVGEE